MKVINDVHIGTSRKAGTTPATQEALRSFLHQGFRDLLCGDDHIVINGDLFDSFEVESREVVETFVSIADYLHGGSNKITLIAGNHDYNPRGGKLSSFHLLCHFLRSQFPDQVTVIDHTVGFSRVAERVWAIPHMPNQDLFNMEVEKAIAGEGGVLLVHCNVMSHYCDHSDHSLNLSELQVDALIAAGWRIVAGHEHQYSTRRNGRVLVSGNQICTSVSDCLNCDAKGYVRIENGVDEWVKLGNLNFAEVDWQSEVLPDEQFLRVTGTATAEQAADVVARVAAIRRASSAFVIGNAVKVEGMPEFDDLSEASFEDVKQVDVLSLLLEELSEDEQKAVKGLLA